MFVALLVPAVGIGSVIVILVGPTLMKDMFGDANLAMLETRAHEITPEAMATLVDDNSFVGLTYEDGAWAPYHEAYGADGYFSGGSGLPYGAAGTTWRGTWKIDGKDLCITRSRAETCGRIYSVGDEYQAVNNRGEVNLRFREVAPSPDLSPDAWTVRGDLLAPMLTGATLDGERFGAFASPQFSAIFEADGTVSSRSGETAATLGTASGGTWRVVDNQLCLDGVLDFENACMTVYRLGRQLAFMAADEPIVVSAALTR